MKMRHKRRGLYATPDYRPAARPLLRMLETTRAERRAMLRKHPDAAAFARELAKGLPGPARRELLRMVREDLAALRNMDRRRA